MLNPVLIKPVYPHHVSLKRLCQARLVYGQVYVCYGYRVCLCFYDILIIFEMKNRDIWIRVSVWMLQTLSKQSFIYIMVIRKYIFIKWWCWWTVRFVQGQHHEVGFNNASPLKQQSVGRHIIPLWRITFIPSVWSLMLLVERGSSNKCQLFSLWFDPTWARSIALEVSTITISSLMMSYENTK
jgi:hypothetical protein